MLRSQSTLEGRQYSKGCHSTDYLSPGGQTVADESPELEAVLISLVDDAPRDLQTIHVRQEQEVQELGEDLLVVMNLDREEADIQLEICLRRQGILFKY